MRVRLDRALSKLGLASRSEARSLILAGRVTVAGRVVRDPATPVVLAPRSPGEGGAGTAPITIDGRQPSRSRRRTIVLHKPRGVITTRRDPEGRRTVFDLLGDQAEGLVAAGRLDLATTGLLILTTETQLANRLTDPANGFIRRYVVTVRGEVTDEHARVMKDGVAGMKAHSVVIRKRSKRETHLTVELTEGKNREVRRLCDAAGHEVTRLKRIAFGPIELGDLPPGQWRELTHTEEDALAAINRR